MQARGKVGAAAFEPAASAVADNIRAGGDKAAFVSKSRHAERYKHVYKARLAVLASPEAEKPLRSPLRCFYGAQVGLHSIPSAERVCSDTQCADVSFSVIALGGIRNDLDDANHGGANGDAREQVSAVITIIAVVPKFPPYLSTGFALFALDLAVAFTHLAVSAFLRLAA